ncbi:MAG: hypothetical protein KAQ64_00040 [Candidatus Pacebacteria bacterium]|nr:hypothetical protein [Candidatus Paceibacterota bacterium]
MQNKNDNSNKEENKRKLDDFSKLDPSNELKSGPKEKLLGNNSKKDIFLGGNLDNPGKKEENLRKKILDKDKERDIENIANNISAESKEVDNLPINSNKSIPHAKKKNKDLTIPIILGVVSILIIGSVAAYFLINKKTEQEKEYPQQQIIKSSMRAMNGVERYAFKGDVNINISSEGNLPDGGDPINFSLEMNFDGQTDQSDINDVKSSFNVRPEINVSTASGDENISLDLSMMSFGKISEQILYYKINDFDLGAVGLIYGNMIVPYKNKWYFLDMKELQKMSGVSMEENNFDFEKMTEEIMELYQKYEMIEFKRDLGDTEINGQSAYHYQIEIDSEALLDFYVDIVKIMSSELALSSDNALEDFDAELEENRGEILAVLNEIMANIETEIWIGKEDKMIYKINISGKYDQGDLKRIASIPLGKAKGKALDAEIKSNMSYLKTRLELYYDDHNGSYLGFDPMDSSYYNVENINVIADEDAYLIWAELASTTDKWCVDSSGVSKSVYGDIEGTKCDSAEESKGELKNYDDLVEKDLSEMKEKFDLSFEMNLLLSDFNKPANIVKPEEAEDLMKIMEEAFGGFMGNMMSGANNGLDLDNDGLSDEMEEIYGTDKNNPDTDGDGYKDGEEVKNGYDPTVPGNARLDYDKLFNTQ